MPPVCQAGGIFLYYPKVPEGCLPGSDVFAGSWYYPDGPGGLSVQTRSPGLLVVLRNSDTCQTARSESVGAGFMGKIIHAHYPVDLGKRTRKPDRPFTIAVLADLHNRVYRSDIASVISAVREEGCEAVLSAGDLLVRHNEKAMVDQALELIGALAGDMPFILVNGNHETRMQRLMEEEYVAYEQKARQMGALALHNSTIPLFLHGSELRITSLELDRTYFRRWYHQSLDADKIRQLAGKKSSKGYSVLIAHHPKFFEAYAQWGADLTLSGHIHGGIVRLPVLGGVISPDPELFPHYDHGLYTIGDSKMIVSAGLGSHSINFRFNNPAEIVFLDCF